MADYQTVASAPPPKRIHSGRYHTTKRTGLPEINSGQAVHSGSLNHGKQRMFCNWEKPFDIN
jgi:hypothetical protein